MELVILCGLQASGKSTFRRERLSEHVTVSKDLMRNNRRREQRQRELIAGALANELSVVVDNTNPAAVDREPLLAIGRAHGASTTAYYLESDFATAMERNAGRSGREVVPHVGLVDVARRLEPPTFDEDFDAIWLVRAVDGSFDVRPVAVRIES